MFQFFPWCSVWPADMPRWVFHAYFWRRTHLNSSGWWTFSGGHSHVHMHRCSFPIPCPQLARLFVPFRPFRPELSLGNGHFTRQTTNENLVNVFGSQRWQILSNVRFSASTRILQNATWAPHPRSRSRSSSKQVQAGCLSGWVLNTCQFHLKIRTCGSHIGPFSLPLLCCAGLGCSRFKNIV